MYAKLYLYFKIQAPHFFIFPANKRRDFYFQAEK